MINGSHNSITYMPPRGWRRVFAFMARCQSVDLREQWRRGVRCFDLRIRFSDDGQPMLVHNYFVYTIGQEALSQVLMTIYLCAMQSNERAWVRILHDIRRPSQDTEYECRLFKELCANLEDERVTYFGGSNLIDGRTDFQFATHPTVIERHASVCWPKWLHWWPWLYAALHPKHDDLPNGDILLTDFTAPAAQGADVKCEM